MEHRYDIGSTVFNHWTITRLIGAGSFGKVFEIQREDFGLYRAALKLITVPQSEAELKSALEEGMDDESVRSYFYSVVEDIVREFALMSKLKGVSNVVSYEDHEVIPHKGGLGWDVLIRMEILNPLLDYAYAHPFSRRDIIKLGIDLCRALELCQKYNILHRDIKPENIFVSDSGDFKLGDFGIARTMERTMSGLSKKGTYNYMAPEIYRGEDYGFSVDIYSLGIVMYRLLNNNRIPFLPPAPAPITYANREEALARRMSGETIPAPANGAGRLGEIVLKACAFDPKERYSSPMLLRQELEAILYDTADASVIYPTGDELLIYENKYATQRRTDGKAKDGSDETVSPVGKTEPTVHDELSATVIDGAKPALQDPGEAGTVVEKAPARQEKKKKASKRWLPAAAICAALAVVGGFFAVQKLSAGRQTAYQQMMTEATELCQSDPAAAMESLLQAQKQYPDEAAPFTAYAYALYCARDYDGCISYIEDDLALGKNYDADAQSRLSEILGSAYFEKGDYTEAASFYRLSTAGGDVTAAAMRDYAISLGRMGDFEAADEVLQRMYDAGADNDTTDFVQAEVKLALKDYTAAEEGFLAVLNKADDAKLQIRCIRSLGELYRDCAALSAAGASPIDRPATKAAELLSGAIVQYSLQYDGSLWEMLAQAYYSAYLTDPDAPADYPVKAADSFKRVIELGFAQDNIYRDLYTLYYEQQGYDEANQVLAEYEAAFPADYMPHALRGVLLITLENTKGQDERDYSAAVGEYEAAKELLRGDDDTTYFQQLEGLIDQLRANGWL